MSVGEAANSKLERFGNDEHERWLKERAAEEMYRALKWVSGFSWVQRRDTNGIVSAALAKAEGRHG